jgi:hypothetical protein
MAAPLAPGRGGGDEEPSESGDDTPEAKKMSRILKNRQSAKRSREAARQHLEILERNVAILAKESQMLMHRLALVEAENTHLRQTQFINHFHRHKQYTMARGGGMCRFPLCCRKHISCFAESHIRVTMLTKWPLQAGQQRSHPSSGYLPSCFSCRRQHNSCRTVRPRSAP